MRYVSVTSSCAQHWLIAGQSVDQHFLASYHHAILAIILAQFSPRGFSDGMGGIVKLVEASSYLKACICCTPLHEAYL